MKKCPYCAELIQDEAKLCRYCGKELPKEKVWYVKKETKSFKPSDIIWMILFILFLIIICCFYNLGKSTSSSPTTNNSPSSSPNLSAINNGKVVLCCLECAQAGQLITIWTDVGTLTVAGYVPSGTSAIIVDGPQYYNNVAFYKVKTGNITGWITYRFFTC